MYQQWFRGERRFILVEIHVLRAPDSTRIFLTRPVSLPVTVRRAQRFPRLIGLSPEGLCGQTPNPKSAGAVQLQAHRAGVCRFAVRVRHKLAAQIAPKMRPVPDGPNGRPPVPADGNLVHDGLFASRHARP
jgi:hypothetical protein